MEMTHNVRTFINWRLLTTATLFASIIALGTACGSGSESSPAQANTPEPTPTFQSIQVTVPPEDIPTATPEPQGTPSTKGGPRSFPEILKNPEGLTVGPLVSSWQNYLDDSVIVFGNNKWDMCAAGNGIAEGDLMNGGMVWTIGLPREGMVGKEVFMLLWNPINDIGLEYVLGYDDGNPILKIITNYEYTDTVTPFTYEGDPIPFETFELTGCLNL